MLKIFEKGDEAKGEFFLSIPEQIATLKVEPRRLIGELVSPPSGQLTLKQTDLVAKGGSKHQFKPQRIQYKVR